MYGTNKMTIIGGLKIVTSLTLQNDRLFWTDEDSHVINAINIDGSNKRQHHDLLGRSTKAVIGMDVVQHDVS